MVVIKLSPLHKEILHALMTLYKKKSRRVKAEEIADFVNKYRGTIRNQVQILKSLGLVDSTCGPKGGYKPTAKAYELLGVTKPKESNKVLVIVNGRLKDLSVETIEFPSIPHSDIFQARIKLVGNTKEILIGDTIRIGPIPKSRLTIHGKVIGRDDTENMIVVDVEKIAILQKGVCASQNRTKRKIERVSNA